VSHNFIHLVFLVADLYFNKNKQEQEANGKTKQKKYYFLKITLIRGVFIAFY